MDDARTQAPSQADTDADTMPATFLPLVCTSFQSAGEYAEYLRQDAVPLAARRMHEVLQPAARGGNLAAGTCGICLRSARFLPPAGGGVSSRPAGDPAADAGWADGQRCDCPAGLCSRDRAVLQFVLGNVGLRDWHRVLMLHRPGAVGDALAAVAGPPDVLPLRRIGAPPAQVADVARPAYQIAVGVDVMQHAADPAAVLAQVAARLVPGGTLVFTTPFDADRPVTIRQGDRQRIGWDILALARAAGLRTTAANLYWSAEFGYLGPRNFIFTASR